MSRLLKISPHFLFALTGLIAAHAYADCTNPAGKEADIKYNGDYHTYQFCNGTNWIPYQAGYSWGQQSTFNPTIAPGSGFFVLTSTTWNGNLGGLSGADAKCLTELTTNTGWKNYSTANGNGQLIAGKVYAFLCSAGGATCNNLAASTTYYFANAGNSSAGGASFTTDSSGLGPGDSANWSAANYFSGTYTWWSNHAPNTSTMWNNGYAGACTSFTSSSAGLTAYTGITGSTTGARWVNNFFTCDNTYNLICFVNP